MSAMFALLLALAPQGEPLGPSATVRPELERAVIPPVVLDRELMIADLRALQRLLSPRSQVDLSVAIAQAIAELPDHEARFDFGRRLERWLATIDGGAHELWPPFEKRFRWRLPWLEWQSTREGWVLAANRSDIPSLRVGDILLTVDGDPPGTAVNPLPGLGDTRLTPFDVLLSVARPSAVPTAREVRLPAESTAPYWANDGRWLQHVFGGFIESRMEASNLSFVSFHGMGGTCSWHVFMPGATPDQVEVSNRQQRRKCDTDWAGEAHEQFVGRSALVLDIRGASGGFETGATELMRWLIPGTFELGRPATRGLDPRPSGEAVGDTSWGDVLLFQGPIACLVDERTRGVPERFVAALRDQRADVVVVGRRTAGRPVVPSPVGELPSSGMTLASPDVAWLRPSGELLDGHGVQPDVPVTWSYTDVLTGRDPDLEAARAALGR